VCVCVCVCVCVVYAHTHVAPEAVELDSLAVFAQFKASIRLV
jgi:hypothetical protein